MNVDNALAKFSIFSKMLDGGDTGKGRVEHRNFLQLRFTHHKVRPRLKIINTDLFNHLRI